eukprot:gnl/TRDRNA2_/TRDRNA2_94350_c0_seq1.p1 gnl/TRDRNA2_/TRDRNA2_94350_c0~~gnl/TRDRNA2_/TRDRNA2_94350_c0_seq1.p1  ORF type:complete len:513 (+),score=113.98 gnl/TRDRNA2_/TRDRNA2_94350_c0_seq1:194-1540(+)
MTLEAPSDVSFTISSFKEFLENLHRKYPDLHVVGNLMKFLKENQSEEADPDVLSGSNIEKIFKMLDKDGSGELDLMEVFKLFKYCNLPMSLIVNKRTADGAVTPDELGPMLCELDQENPHLDIGEKILGFLGEALSAGGSESVLPDSADPSEDPPADEPEEVTGTRRALIIGINYIGTNNSLGGCINDAKNQKALLMDQFGFEEDNIKFMTDEEEGENKPTAENMKAAIADFVASASGEDLLFFSYSGHGSQMKDPSGEEPDGKNECLCPCDCMEGPWPDYVVLDNELYKAFHDDLPSGARLLCVYDCCHSGSMGDLAFTYGNPTASRDIVEEEDAGRYLPPPESAGTEEPECTGQARALSSDSEDDKRIWAISGCQDAQTSADATIDGVRQGALTWALHSALKDMDYHLNYQHVIAATRKKLKGKYSQIPAMSTTSRDEIKRFYLAK